MNTGTATQQSHAPLLSTSDLERLVRDHGRRLRNFIRRRIGNAADVEDLVQDTCLEALRCIGRYQGQSKPETWLFGIALNLVRGHYKQSRSRSAMEHAESAEDTPVEMAEDPRETLERQQEIHRLVRIVDRLPAQSIAVLTLVFDDQLTYSEAASRLQIPIGTVRSRIARARVMLRGEADVNTAQESA